MTRAFVKHWILSSIIGLLTLGAFAQTVPTFQRITSEQGLSNNEIQALAQDKAGFLWIGTTRGLNRFDGRRFQAYHREVGNPASLSNSHVTAILSDRGGNLWVGTQSGLNLMEGDGFKRFSHVPKDLNTLSHNHVHFIIQDDDGSIWIGAERGLNRLDPKTGQVKRFMNMPLEGASISSDRVRCVARDGQGRLWFGTDGGGLNVFEGSGFRHYRHNPEDPDSLADDHVISLSFNESGHLYIGFRDGRMDRVIPGRGQFQHFQHRPEDSQTMPPGPILTLLSGEGEGLWLGTPSGLSYYNPERNLFEHFHHDPRDSASLSHNTVGSLFQDGGGVLWVGAPNGLNKWNAVIGSFTHYKVDPLNNAKLNNNAVTAFAEEEDGSLWVATQGGGLNRLNPDTQTFEYYTHNPEDPGSLRDNMIMSLLVDREKNLWAGSMSAGISRYDRDTNRFQHIQAPARGQDPGPDTLLGNGISCIAQTRDGSLWIGSYFRGLSKRDPETGLFTHYPHDRANQGGLPDPRLVGFVEDHDGALWLGTDGGGLVRLQPETEEFTQYLHDPNNHNSLRSNSVRHLYLDGKGRLWVATTGGLHSVEAADLQAGTPVFKRYNRRNGLLNDTVYGVLEDDQGHIWLSCVKGLIQLDPERETFTHYNDPSRGLQHYEFNAGACYKGSNGRLYFGGINGFNAFHPHEILPNEHKPAVALTAFLKSNEPVITDVQPWELDEVEIKFGDSLVSFEFAALDYTAPEKNQYRYKMEGFDADWIELGNRQRATYTNIKTGRFVFRVQASNNDGVWNEEGLALGVRVQPAPWFSKSALGLYALILVSILFFIKRSHDLKLAQEAEFNRELEQEVEARTHELQQQNDQLAEVNRKLAETSLTDPLTGLRNRRFLQNRFAEFKHSKNLIFLVFDLDNLKNINSTQGHGAGDLVLIQIRQNLEKFGLKSALFCRLGGDEFLIICPCPDEAAARWLAENVRKRIASTRFAFGNRKGARLTCSLGFTFFPFSKAQPDIVNWEQALIIAERALGAVKKSGKNAWLGLLPGADVLASDFFDKFNENPHTFVENGILSLHSSLKVPIRLTPSV